METLVLDVPAMYADHHVVEVRRILFGLPGVEDVDASSAFRVVEVCFDAARISADSLRQRLDEAGYLADLQVQVESGEPAVGRETDGETYFRHSVAHEIVGTSVAFEQEVSLPGRPLWPCPGVGPAMREDDEGLRTAEA